MLVLGGLVWKFHPAILAQVQKTIDTREHDANPTPSITDTPVPTHTQTGEVLPTGREISIKLDSRRGFLPHNQPNISEDLIEIEPGDTVVWFNDGKEPVTLVSDMPGFGTRLLDFDKRTRYLFNKTGTYYFYFKDNENLNSTILVRS